MSDTVGLEHLPALLLALLAPAFGWLLMRKRPAYAAAGPLTKLTATLLAVTGGAHLGLVVHALPQPVTAGLFGANGVLFLSLAYLAFTWRWWRPAAGLLLVPTIAGYLVYVGFGWEGPDQAGIAIKLVELCALGLVMVPARPGRGFWRSLRWTGATAALLFMTLLTGAVPWGASFRPAAASDHAHGGNPVTVVEEYDRPVTPADQAAADRLLADVRLAIAGYADPRAAYAAGYRQVSGPGDPLVHWQNDALKRPDGHVDVHHPPGLVYGSTRHGPVLLGAFYQMSKIGERGPDLAGPAVLWHHHTNICIAPVPGFIVGLNSPFRGCPFLSVSISGPAMVHVWTIANPDGPFAHDLNPDWVKQLINS